MTVALAYEQGFGHILRLYYLFLRLDAGVLSCVGEVVEGIYVFKKTALLQIPDAAGPAAWVKVVRHFVCLGIKLIIIEAFVYPYAPKYDAGMISVFFFGHYFAP